MNKTNKAFKFNNNIKFLTFQVEYFFFQLFSRKINFIYIYIYKNFIISIESQSIITDNNFLFFHCLIFIFLSFIVNELSCNINLN